MERAIASGHKDMTISAITIKGIMIIVQYELFEMVRQFKRDISTEIGFTIY